MMTEMEQQLESQGMGQQLEHQLDLCIISHDPMPMPEDMVPRATALLDTPSGPAFMGRAPCNVWGDTGTASHSHAMSQSQQLPQQQPQIASQQPMHQRIQPMQQQPQLGPAAGSGSETRHEPDSREHGADGRGRKRAKGVDDEPEKPVTPTWGQLPLGYGLTTILEDHSDIEEGGQSSRPGSFTMQQVAFPMMLAVGLGVQKANLPLSRMS